MSQSAEPVDEVPPDEARELAQSLRDIGFDRLADWAERQADRKEEQQ